MKTYIKIAAIVLTSMLFQYCSEDEGFFGEDIFNNETNYPYVSIQDRNEDLEEITGNNFWSFELTAEDDGNQVRIAYDSQDPNIISHDIIVGFDGAVSPPEDGVVLMTLDSFPNEIVISKQDLANALSVNLEELETGSVYFGGLSRDEDGHQVTNPENFEDFLQFERHAYDYEWKLDQ